MIDLFENAFWYIIEGACTVLLHKLKYLPGAQEAYDKEAVRHYRPLLEIHLLPMSGLFFIPDHLKDTRDVLQGSGHITTLFSTCT